MLPWLLRILWWKVDVDRFSLLLTRNELPLWRFLHIITFPILVFLLLWEANVVVVNPGSNPQLWVEILVVEGSSTPVRKQVNKVTYKIETFFQSRRLIQTELWHKCSKRPSLMFLSYTWTFEISWWRAFYFQKPTNNKESNIIVFLFLFFSSQFSGK